ncbi:MAG: hypothetical protein GY940_10125 [bacterium]|nr:hypothetical protein [bacterium]
MIKKQVIITLIVLLVFHAVVIGKKKKEILFPRREYIKKQSRLFFKQMNMNHPLVEKVDFFARSKAYLSAYLAFSPFLVKHPFLKKILPWFEGEHKPLIEKFSQYKRDISIGNYPGYLELLKITKLQLYLLSLHMLVNDYQTNMLSGDSAFKLWNIMLKLSKSTYKDKNKTVENAALLKLSSHFIFFKKYKKWQKKAAKILKKINLSSITDKTIRTVLEL